MVYNGNTNSYSIICVVVYVDLPCKAFQLTKVNTHQNENVLWAARLAERQADPPCPLPGRCWASLWRPSCSCCCTVSETPPPWTALSSSATPASPGERTGVQDRWVDHINMRILCNCGDWVSKVRYVGERVHYSNSNKDYTCINNLSQTHQAVFIFLKIKRQSKRIIGSKKGGKRTWH